MESELTCPDCGGIVGATQVTDQGKPCTCFSGQSPARKSSSSEMSGSSGSSLSSDPIISSGDASNDTSVINRPAKICCNCGADLAGRKRYRDSRGYWCSDCQKADDRKNQPQGVKCPGCDRIVPEAALADYEGIPICARCRHERSEAKKEERRRSPVSSETFERYEHKKFFILAGVAAVLLLIILLKHVGLLGH